MALMMPQHKRPNSTPYLYNAAVDLIERNLAARPDKIAYIDEHGSYSFADLAERVIAAPMR